MCCRWIGVVTALWATACLSAPPGPGVSDDGGTEPTPPSKASAGNLLMYTFDDYQPVDIYRDHSGNKRTLYSASSRLTDGRHGNAVDVSPSFTARMFDSMDLFVDELTLETWIRPHETFTGGRIFGDGDSNLELDWLIGDGTVILRVNSGDPAIHVEATCPESLTALGWTHLAVTWDRQTARFYSNGVLSCTEDLAASPVAATSRWELGRLSADLDELKVSDWIKTEEDILQSMNFDSSSVRDLCGDGFVVSTAFACEPPDPCCADTCDLRRDGECSDATGLMGQCNSSGLCVPEEAGPVTTGIIAQYLFDEGSGATVADSSGVVPAVDLQIADADLQHVSWNDNSLLITDSTILTASTDAQRINSAVMTSQQLTLEAWVEPAQSETVESLPRRIVSIAPGINAANLVLGQSGSAYVARLRVDLSLDDGGTPHVASGPGRATAGSANHLVLTYANDVATLYVDGRMAEIAPRVGGLQSWDPAYLLHLANELGSDRSWTGELHTVVIYDRALGATEVARNFLVGPR